MLIFRQLSESDPAKKVLSPLVSFPAQDASPALVRLQATSDPTKSRSICVKSSRDCSIDWNPVLKVLRSSSQKLQKFHCCFACAEQGVTCRLRKAILPIKAFPQCAHTGSRSLQGEPRELLELWCLAKHATCFLPCTVQEEEASVVLGGGQHGCHFGFASSPQRD
jgi:hypothetical protein